MANGHFGISNAVQTHWLLQKTHVKPFLNLAETIHLHVKSMSDMILGNLSHRPFKDFDLPCQNCFRKMFKVEGNNSTLTDVTVQWGSVPTSDDAQHCCTNFDKCQSHCSRVRAAQGFICLHSETKWVVLAVAHVHHGIIYTVEP